MSTPGGEARSAAERAARDSYGRLIAYLAARSGDLAGAEDALAEAFAAALEQWPKQGVPRSPAAWLLAVARRRQSDGWRRQQSVEGSVAHLKLLADEIEAAASEADAIPDRRLALMFASADPAIDRNAVTALILQTILGLTASEIAAAFLVPSATMSQRLVRAKARIRDTGGVAFRIPNADELPLRLDAVLESIYAAYGKGWADTTDTGPSPFAHEGIWLGRLVVSLLPDEPEAKGMLALMLYTEARRPARRDDAGTYVALNDQNTQLWDREKIEMAERLLLDANENGPTGRYQIEAAIQSAHTARRLHGVSNWKQIGALYDMLFSLAPSPVVALNRAVALFNIGEQDAALAQLGRLSTEDGMATYQPYWAARGHLSGQAGLREEAWESLTIAIGLSTDPGERRYLQRWRDEFARR